MGSRTVIPLSPFSDEHVKDSEWVVELLQHSLLHPSFVLEMGIRDLRDLTNTCQGKPRRAGSGPLESRSCVAPRSSVIAPPLTLPCYRVIPSTSTRSNSTIPGCAESITAQHAHAERFRARAVGTNDPPRRFACKRCDRRDVKLPLL